MTAIVILIAVIALGPLAVKYGSDSSAAARHADELHRRGWWPGNRGA